jgi:hypothetical protein
MATAYQARYPLGSDSLPVLRDLPEKPKPTLFQVVGH